MSDGNGVIIDASAFDPHFRDEIIAEPGGEHIWPCVSCSACTAGCPVARVTAEYNPRRIIHMARLGMREQVLSSDAVWLRSRDEGRRHTRPAASLSTRSRTAGVRYLSRVALAG